MKRRLPALVCAALLLPAGGCPAGAAAAAASGRDDPLAAFSVRLFREALSESVPNPVISPLSAWFALGMASEGAAGETLGEFSAVLGVPAGDLAAFASSRLARLGSAGGNTTLRLANSGWIDRDFTASESYAAKIADAFGAEAFSAELSSWETVRAINAWVNGKTRGLIPSLHDEPLPEDAVYALLNTLYFKARWMQEFLGSCTTVRDFRREDGTAAAADFLNDWECTRDLIALDGAEGILLPYDDGQTAFLALRPTDGRSARDFAEGLTTESLASYVGAARHVFMDFAMPKFTLVYSLSLNDALKAMGLRLAFDADRADFSPMGTSAMGNLFISEVFQKVKMEVNEEGTEAAAVTEVEMAAGAAPPEEIPFSLVLDSPYVYAVIERETCVPLFMGLMEDPPAQGK